MPKKYTSMKEKFMQEGLPEKAAQTKAAKIFNAQRAKGARPVTGKTK